MICVYDDTGNQTDYIMTNKRHAKFVGYGLIRRDIGREPPKFRQLLEKIGNEKVESLTVYRQPISVEKVLNIITNDGYKKLVNKAGYDNLFHLGININSRYNLDKQSVLHLEKGKIPIGAEILKINLGNVDISVNDMINKTKSRMKNDYSEYSANENNCQDFILNLLSANHLSNSTANKFIKQDTKTIFDNLPKYSDAILKVITDTHSAIDRQIEGE